MENYDEDSSKGYILEVDIEYPKDLHNFHSDLPFLLEGRKIKKCSKLQCNLYDKKQYVVHVRALKQSFNHGLTLKKYRVIQLDQEAWLEPHIEMNTKLRTEAKSDFNKYFFKLSNSSVFGKLRKMSESIEVLTQ